MVAVNGQKVEINTAVELWTSEGYKVCGIDQNGNTLILCPTGLEENQALEIVKKVRDFTRGEYKPLAEVEDLVAGMVGSMVFGIE